jgi:hypothetical protein
MLRNIGRHMKLGISLQYGNFAAFEVVPWEGTRFGADVFVWRLDRDKKT